MKEPYNSRLEKNLENQTKKYIVYTVIGIIIVGIILVIFGIPIILGTSSLFSHNNTANNQNTNSFTEPTFIAAPILNSIPKATKNATQTISGTAPKGTEVQLYNNSAVVDKSEAESNGSFSFIENLEDGTNTFTAKAVKDGKSSDASNQISIDFHKNPPNLTIDNPADQATISHDQNPITVSGKTDPNAVVTVNDHQATIDENGKYSYVLNLQNGGGQDIRVEAVDDAGNKTDKQIHITYNP